MAKNVMLRGHYVLGKVLELVERQCRNAGHFTQGVMGHKSPRLRLVSDLAALAEQPVDTIGSTRVDFAIPLTNNDGQFFAVEEIAAVLVAICKVAGGFSCALGLGFSFGETVSIDLVLWSSAVVANDKVAALRIELETLQPMLKQDSIFASMSPATVAFLVANDNAPDENLAG
jgi:hypothetical protein